MLSLIFCLCKYYSLKHDLIFQFCTICRYRDDLFDLYIKTMNRFGGIPPSAGVKYHSFYKDFLRVLLSTFKN